MQQRLHTNCDSLVSLDKTTFTHFIVDVIYMNLLVLLITIVVHV